MLFVFDNWKREWELPGGSREPGESPRECAIRELREETGKQPVDLAFHSLIEWRLGKEQRPEFGALFTCTIAGAAATMETSEIGKTLFWDLRTDIGEVSVLDHTLAAVVVKGYHI